MKRVSTLAILSAALCTTSSHAQFDIVLNYNDTPTAAEAAAFSAAEATWESIISGYQETDIESTILTIDINLEFIDGVGNTLGQAGPTSVKLNAAENAIAPTFLYANTGTMTFDTADTADLEADGDLALVILHEMAHVLGIGTLWSSAQVAADSSNASFAGRQELYVDGTGQYTGEHALEYYNLEWDDGVVGDATFVPVELGGGSGTADAHWNEGNGGSPTGITKIGTGEDFFLELMTGWLNDGSFISNVTIGGLEDLGYNVNYIAVPEPATASLALLGAGALFLRRRRREA